VLSCGRAWTRSVPGGAPWPILLEIFGMHLPRLFWACTCALVFVFYYSSIVWVWRWYAQFGQVKSWLELNARCGRWDRWQINRNVGSEWLSDWVKQSRIRGRGCLAGVAWRISSVLGNGLPFRRELIEQWRLLTN